MGQSKFVYLFRARKGLKAPSLRLSRDALQTIDAKVHLFNHIDRLNEQLTAIVQLFARTIV